MTARAVETDLNAIIALLLRRSAADQILVISSLSESLRDRFPNEQALDSADDHVPELILPQHSLDLATRKENFESLAGVWADSDDEILNIINEHSIEEEPPNFNR